MKIEIFSAGCRLCHDTVELVTRIAKSTDELHVLDMQEADNVARATQLGIRSLPAVVIDGRIANCCASSGPDEQTLKSLLGASLST